MMRTQKWIVVICCLLLSIGLAAREVQAVPLPPATLWGTFTIDGVLAPDGTVLNAQIGGITYASTTVGTHDGQPGLYSIDVPADDPVTPEVEGGKTGQTIILAGEGIAIAQSTIWQSGAVIQVELTGTPFEVSFSCAPRSGAAPLQVSCTPTMTGSVNIWLWDFGDGAASTIQNAMHVYSLPGIYAVRLTVTGPAGSAGHTASNYITVTTPLPTANAGGPYSVGEGGSIQLNGTGSDPSGISTPLIYEWDLNNDGNFETAGQRPTFNATGLDGPAIRTVRLRVTNRFGGIATNAATVTVDNVAPTAMDDGWVTGEDNMLTIPAPGVLTNDYDPGDDSLLVVNYNQISSLGAAVSIGANGELQYDPTPSAGLEALAEGSIVVDTFDYIVDDGDGKQDAATVMISITGINDAPVAVDDRATTAEDQAVSLFVLANDIDVDGNNLAITLVGPASHGSIVNHNTHLFYTPAKNFNSVDSFTYTVSDGKASDSATVSVTVGRINDPPLGREDAYSTNENTPLVEGSPGLLVNDEDPDGDTIAVVGYQSVSAQGASVHVNTNGGYQYDPTDSATIQAMAAGATLEDTFTYTITDPAGMTAIAEVVITLHGMNDLPEVSDALFSLTENSPAGTIVGLVVASDLDAHDHLSYTIATGNDNAVFDIDSDTGQLSVAGSLDFECKGSYKLEVQVSDRHGQSNVGLITVQIIDAADAPSACGLVDPLHGGTVRLVLSDLEIEAMFPPGAVSEPLTLVIQLSDGHTIPDTLRLLGRPFVIRAITQHGVAVNALSASYTLTIAFTESQLAQKYQETIGLYRWDAPLSQYLEDGSAVELQPNRVVMALDSLGEFAVLELVAAGPSLLRIHLPNIRYITVQPVTCTEPVTHEKIWVGGLTSSCDLATTLAGRPAIKLHSEVPSIAELYSSLLPVQPNTLYRVSYSVKTDLVSQGAEMYGKVIVAQYDDHASEEDALDRNRLDPGFNLGESVGGESDWVTKSYTFQTTPTTAYVRLRAVLGGPVGTVQGSMWVTSIMLTLE